MEIVDPRVDPRLVPAGSRATVVNGPRNEYRDLPSIWTPDGQVITRWQLSDEERAAIVRGEDIYVTLISGGLINPFFVTVGPVNWAAKP
jgi:dihydrofolate reductase